MTQQDLYLKAIDLDLNFVKAYSNLGTILSSGGSIQLLNGTLMTRGQLMLKIDFFQNIKKIKHTRRL